MLSLIWIAVNTARWTGWILDRITINICHGLLNVNSSTYRYMCGGICLGCCCMKCIRSWLCCGMWCIPNAFGGGGPPIP